MQAQEVLKLIHDMPVDFGQVTHFNGLNNQMHTTAYVEDPDCESHWNYGSIIEVPQAAAARTTVREMLGIARRDLGPDAVLELDQEIVIALTCPIDNTREDVFRPLKRVSYDEGICPICGNLRQIEMTHVITGDEVFLDRPLSAIGVPPLHIIRARNSAEYRFYELTGDEAEALHFSHFAELDRDIETMNGTQARIKIGRDKPRPRIKLQDARR
jgi:sulfur-carrier protein adenylyltransferase/sulfurtransferase